MKHTQTRPVAYCHSAISYGVFAINISFHVAYNLVSILKGTMKQHQHTWNPTDWWDAMKVKSNRNHPRQQTRLYGWAMPIRHQHDILSSHAMAHLLTTVVVLLVGEQMVDSNQSQHGIQ